MSDAATLLQDQTDDYAGLLKATRAVLAGSLEAESVVDYRRVRNAVLARTHAREGNLIAALGPDAPADALARYREVLEALVTAERELTDRAAERKAGLAAELEALGAGQRALAGYRRPRGADPAWAVNRHV